MNVLPANFEHETSGNVCCVLMLAGFALIFVLEQAAIKLKNKPSWKQFGLIGKSLSHSFSKKYFVINFKRVNF